MRRLVLSSLRSHKGRLALTLVAITLSVGFVTASFALADSLRAVFNDVSSEIYDGVDAEVRAGDGDFDQIASGTRFAQIELTGLSEVDGVEQLVPSLGAEFALFAVDGEGETVRPPGPPVLNFSVGADPANPAALADSSPFTMTAGRPPVEGEVMLDRAQAEVLEIEVGDDVLVATSAGPETFTLSGTVIFGDQESGVSPYFLLFDLGTMQRLLDAPGLIDGAAVLLSDDAESASVFAAMSAVLPDSLFIADQTQLISEQQDEFGELIDIIQIALLAFAAITTFVAVFVIANTFAVLVGQQMKQLGLLRAIGATSRQAGTVIVTEAALVGIIASTIGLGVGLLTAQGIKMLFESVTTGGFPDGPLELAPRTVIAAFLVGVGVTVLSAIIPARKAAKTTPMQAIQESAVPVPARRSLLAGLLSLVAAPVGRLFGTSGRLAAMNVKRNPRRVLSTAMSMIVGLALITGMSVLASSYRVTLADAMTSDFDADLILTGVDGGPIPFAATADLANVREVEAVSGFGGTEVLYGGDVIEIASFQSATANSVLDLGIVDGVTTLTSNENSIVSADFAELHGLALGDVVPIEFSDGFVLQSTVEGIYEDDSIITGALLVDHSVVAAHARSVDAYVGAVRFASDVTPEAATAAVASVLDGYSQIENQTVDEFLEARQAQVDQLLVLANSLLGLTVIIAMSGIANTVALSVLERTNEIGLMRSVGMSRRQVRSMIRYEALVTSTLGAVLGIGVGVLIGLATSVVVPDSFISSVVVPGGQVVAYLVVGVLLGVIAAMVPALRASRLNMVTAMRAS